MMIFYEPHERDRELLPHDPFKALVVPRPIGWLSTLGPDGQPNLAPYSFFNAVCDRPPMLMFSSDGMKDSSTFAEANGEFVWNMATYGLREAMNASSTPLPRGQSEFAFAGIATAPSRLVAPPRVAASPVAMECRVTQTLTLQDVDRRGVGRYIVIGQVLGVHIDERLITTDGRVDSAAMEPIARLGYLDDYAVVTSLFALPRPEGAG